MKTPRSMELLRDGIMLEKSYVFQYCAPTRSSILSGRLPYHVNQIIVGLSMPDWDMTPEMTAMPKKLKQAGCYAHGGGGNNWPLKGPFLKRHSERVVDHRADLMPCLC